MVVKSSSRRAVSTLLAGDRRRFYAVVLSILAVAAWIAPTATYAEVVSRSKHATPAGMRGRATLIVHTMPGTTRSRVTASTLLFVPYGKAPDGGWPIAAWAHGSTTPGFKQCAPSLSSDFDGGLTQSGFKSDYGFQLASLVNAGYAVVAPDFEGIGADADAPNPGFNSRSIANALLSGIRAARKVDRTLSSTYMTIGHSEGARALISFDQLARNERDLDHRGTVALAPFTSIRALIAGLERTRNLPDVPDATAVVALQNFIVGLVATGLKVQNPTFDEREIMGRDLALVFPKLRDLCAVSAIGAVTDAVKARGANGFDGFKAGWAEVPAMKRFLDENDPGQMPDLTIKRPMLIIVGSNDDFVPVAPLEEVVRRQLTKGAPVTLEVLQKGDHFSIIRGAQDRLLLFTEQLLGRTEK